MLDLERYEEGCGNVGLRLGREMRQAVMEAYD